MFSRTTFARGFASVRLIDFFRFTALIAVLFMLLPLLLIPQRAFADVAGVDDTITTQTSAHHALYADATAPAPVTDQALAAQQPAAPATVVVTPPPSTTTLPVQNADGSWNLQPLLDGFIKFVGGVLGLVGAWMLSKLSDPLAKYIGIHVDTKEVAKDIGLEAQATNAVRNVIGIIEQKTGWTPDALKNVELKNVFLSMAAALLFKQYPEIWTWLENQEGNALTWIEGKLDPSAKPEPLTVDQAKALLGGGLATPAPKAATG
jgi:hypothetical protein